MRPLCLWKGSDRLSNNSTKLSRPKTSRSFSPFRKLLDSVPVRPMTMAEVPRHKPLGRRWGYWPCAMFDVMVVVSGCLYRTLKLDGRRRDMLIMKDSGEQSRMRCDVNSPGLPPSLPSSKRDSHHRLELRHKAIIEQTHAWPCAKEKKKRLGL